LEEIARTGVTWRLSEESGDRSTRHSPRAARLEPRACSLLDFFLFFLNLDPQRFQEFQVLIADFKLWVGTERGDEGSLVAAGDALLADPDGGFEDEENIVAAFLDSAGDDFGDLFGIGQRLVNWLRPVLSSIA